MAKKKQAEEKPNTQAAAAETETETTPPQACLLYTSDAADE